MVYPFFQNGNTNILIRGIDLSQTYNKLALWDVTPHNYNEEKFFYGRITLSDVAVFHSSVSMSRFFSEWQGHLAPGRSPLLPIKDSPRATRNFARKGVVTTELGSVTPAQNLFAFTSTIAQEEMVYLSRIIYHFLLLYLLFRHCNWRVLVQHVDIKLLYSFSRRSIEDSTSDFFLLLGNQFQ